MPCAIRRTCTANVKGEKGLTEKRIGIVGGYGSVGLETAKSLLATTSYDVVVGGRNKEKNDAIVEKMGSKVSSRVVDVYDQHSLDNFCHDCDIVINCAGPSRRVVDRVALAAIRQKAHYVDPADASLYNALGDKKEEIKQKGLTFVISAGMNPGLSEILPIYLTKSHFDSVRSLEYYFASQGKVTFSSAYDIVCGIQTNDSVGMMYYENGQIKKSKSAPMKDVLLPAPIGKVSVCLIFTEEMRRVAESCNVSLARFYIAFIGKSTQAALFNIRLSKQCETEAQKEHFANLLVKAVEDDLKNKESCNMFHLIMKGKKDGLFKRLISTMSFENAYKLTGIVAANTARLIIDGFSNEPGCFLLHEGISVNEFMKLLKQQNISAVQSVDDQNSESAIIY